MVVGSTLSTDGDVTYNHGGQDFWLIRLCNNDPLAISVSDTVYCYTTSLSATPGFTSYLWSTGDTTQTIVVDTGGVYSVRGIKSSNCPSESAITIPNPLQPFSGEQICMVTFDSISGRNTILFDKTLNVGTDSISIYRLDNLSSLYVKIHSLGINEPGIFTDNGAIPAQQSYQYKISAKDTCGKESALSEVHRTILLQANPGFNHAVNLLWNPYLGFGYSNFEIYRKTDVRGDFILLANVPNNTYAFTDLNPPTGTIYYQIRITREAPCTIGGSQYTLVCSNIITVGNIGIDELQANSFTVCPNPADDKLTIKTIGQLAGSTYSISDPAGKKLMTGKLTAEISTIDISQLSRGIYLLKLGRQIRKVVKY